MLKTQIYNNYYKDFKNKKKLWFNKFFERDLFLEDIKLIILGKIIYYNNHIKINILYDCKKY